MSAAAIAKAIAALGMAEKQFTAYAEHHHAKGADDKAGTNYGFATLCGDALEHMRLFFTDGGWVSTMSGEDPRVPTRIVTQLAVSAAAGHRDVLYALGSDGSVWRLVVKLDQTWSQLPSLPTTVAPLPADSATDPVA
jgi:hypothetical protein